MTTPRPIGRRFRGRIPGFRRTGRQRVVLACGGVLSVLLLVIAGLIVGVNNKLDLIPRLGADTQLDEVGEGDPRNYLVVGSDDRDGLDPDAPGADVYLGDVPDPEPSGRRADVIMIVRVDPDGERLDVLSVPRDLWLPIAGTGSSQRINTAYSGGPQQLIDTIRENFGIEIHHYAELDFVGFKGIVDAMDGVPMWFDEPMRDEGSGLDIAQSGCVNLDGFQALAFVRARNLQHQTEAGWEYDPTGDWGRMSRQQAFMRRVAEKAANEMSLTDLRSLNEMADLAIDYVTVDQNLEVTKAVNIVRQLGTFEDETLRFHSLPADEDVTDGGADILRLREMAAQAVLNEFREEPVEMSLAAMVSLTVLNGSGVDGQASDVADALEVVGFDVAEVGDAGGTWDSTTVRHAPGSAEEARTVARHITGGAVLDEDDGLDSGVVILVTGSDLTTIMDSPMAEDDPSIERLGETGSQDTAPSTDGPATEGTATAGTNPEADSETRTGQAGATTTTTTTIHGVVPGEPPEGVTCD